MVAHQVADLVEDDVLLVERAGPAVVEDVVAFLGRQPHAGRHAQPGRGGQGHQPQRAVPVGGEPGAQFLRGERLGQRYPVDHAPAAAAQSPPVHRG
ncbi:hypothetical protein CTZ40_31265 [Streptomyces rimosus]|nr:hypothetical protein CTZ40_31265 [Streptomyces rimosus]QEV78836.1 hypothetical protein CP984_31235 [Streptomyces rimosus]